MPIKQKVPKVRLAVFKPGAVSLLRDNENQPDGFELLACQTLEDLAAALEVEGEKALGGVIVFAAEGDLGAAGQAVRLCRKVAPYVAVVAVFPTQPDHARQMLTDAETPAVWRALYGKEMPDALESMRSLKSLLVGQAA